MAKKIKMTFERGGVIYADLQEAAAPHIVEKFCKTLPITYPMLHGRYAGPAMFFNTTLKMWKKRTWSAASMWA